MLRACWKSKKIKRAVQQQCAKDLLFWINFACWTYDPRLDDPLLPMVTWEYQDEALTTIAENIGKRDMVCEKSRDMGASWMFLFVVLWRAMYFPMQSFSLMSRKEALVDSNDSDSLFWKLDFIIDRLPGFLRPKRQRTKLHLGFPASGGTIDGVSTTSDAGRGGRKTAFLIDEAAAFEVEDSHQVNAATANNTECRMWNSTYKGAVGAFYDQAQRGKAGDENVVLISLPWWKHPGHADGLYVDERGKKRSLWYDKKSAALVLSALIAAELDMDPAGAASPLFPQDTIDKMRGHCRRPILRGKVTFDPFNPKSVQFDDDPHGSLWLWLMLQQPMLTPPRNGRYVAGADISTGNGKTNSVLVVADILTREKVAELATPYLSEAAFADQCVAVCHWFNTAYLCWESNGPGQTFGKRVLELGYRNIYYQREEKGLRGKMKAAIIPGWHSSGGADGSKVVLLRDFLRACSQDWWVERSEHTVLECRDYVYQKDGTVDTLKRRTALDPSGAGENHGDRVIASALASHLLGGEPKLEQVKTKEVEQGHLYVHPDPAPYSFQERYKQWHQNEKKKDDPFAEKGGSLRTWKEAPMTAW